MDVLEGLLREYELEHLIQTFRDQGVRSLRALLALQQCELGLLAPTLGDQALLRELRENQSAVTGTTAPTSAPASEPAPVIAPASPTATTVPAARTVPDSPQPGPSTRPDFTPSQPSQAQKRANSQTVTPARKKSKSFDVIEKIRELDLESLLLADRTGGKELLLCFREAQKEFESGNSEDPPTLSDRQRLKLSHILAEYLLTLDDCPSHHNHPLVTKKIVSLFPWETENEYYVAPKTENKQQTHAKGKLVSAIRNINSKRNLLGQVNEPSTSGGDNSRQLSNQTTSFRAIVGIADTSERQGARAWLVHGRTPWPKVIENWILTAPHRFRTHFITSTSGFVNEYINSWPVLSHKSGHQLLLEDFKLLYPGASSRLYDVWEIFARRTLALAKKEIKDQEAIAILKLAENKSLDQNGVASVILHILANIKSNHSIQQEGKRVKVSAGKCRNSYLLTVKTANDITRALEERRSELIDENGGGQPLIVLVCSSPDNVRSAHVSVASLRYDLDSVLEALDVCFKLYQSLHCKYPPESKHIWTVLQRGIYKINLKGDSNILHSWIKLYDLSA